MSKKYKIKDYIIVIISFLVGGFVFIHFDAEGLLMKQQDSEVVSAAQIENSRLPDYRGLMPGDGILSLQTQEDWEDVLNYYDYVTVTVSPQSIIKTNVYGLGNWADRFTRRRNGAQGRRRAEDMRTFLDWQIDYVPYYIIELPDGSHILAQLSRHVVSRIESGKITQLPLGQKSSLRNSARSLLRNICEEYNVSMDYCLYTLNDEWQKKNDTLITIIRGVAAFVVFFILAVVLELLCGAIADRRKAQNQQNVPPVPPMPPMPPMQ